MGNFHFLAAEKQTFWGGGNFKTGLPVIILGHIQACPTRLLAQKTFDILRKRWPNKNKLLGAASLYSYTEIRSGSMRQIGDCKGAFQMHPRRYTQRPRRCAVNILMALAGRDSDGDRRATESSDQTSTTMW